MEQYEIELIERYQEQDEELRKLWQEHQDFEKQLSVFDEKRYLTPQEELEQKRLKKLKLAGKTKIYNILDKYRKLEERNEA